MQARTVEAPFHPRVNNNNARIARNARKKKMSPYATVPSTGILRIRSLDAPKLKPI